MIILVAIIAGIGAPLALRWASVRAADKNAADKPQRFLTLDLVCSSCGHRGCVVTQPGRVAEVLADQLAAARAELGRRATVVPSPTVSTAGSAQPCRPKFRGDS